MERTRKPKRDDEAQSKRFIEMAREIGAEAGEEKFERVFKKVVKESQRPPPRFKKPA